MKRDAPKAWGNESLHHHYLREAAGGRFAQADGKLCEMAFCHLTAEPAAWTMAAARTGLWHRPAAPAGDAIPLGLHPQVRFGGQPPQAALGPEMSARARPTGGLPPPALAGGE